MVRVSEINNFEFMLLSVAFILYIYILVHCHVLTCVWKMVSGYSVLDFNRKISPRSVV